MSAAMPSDRMTAAFAREVVRDCAIGDGARERLNAFIDQAEEDARLLERIAAEVRPYFDGAPNDAHVVLCCVDAILAERGGRHGG